MSLINFFKNKKKDDKKNARQENQKEIKKSHTHQRAMPTGRQVNETKKTEQKDIGAGKTNSKLAVSERQKTGYAPIVHRSIKFPHITEKSSNLANLNKYVFRVLPDANKIEIAKGIAGFYGVKVESVNIINIHRKKRFLRRREGYKSGYKKAIVTLKQGDKIEILPH